MNFLQICQTLRDKCPNLGGSSGLPATVVGQSGDMAEIVAWAREAWVDIQASRGDWQFMRDEFSATVPAGAGILAPADAGLTSFSTWLPRTIRCYEQASGISTQVPIHPSDYDWFRDAYRLGSTATGVPSTFALRPKDKAILLGPVNQNAVVISGEYMRAPQTMAADADVPYGLPEDLHMLIVFQAVLKYAGRWAAPEVQADATNQSSKLISRLVDQWTPSIYVDGGLA